MCTPQIGDREYPGIPPVRPVTHRHMVLMIIGPMSQAGTLSAEELQANIERAVALKHEIEAATGHTVIVPHLDLMHLPPANGKPGWQQVFDHHSHLLQTKVDGIFQMPYEVDADVECVAMVGFWHQRRASITIYRQLREIPKLTQLTV